MRIRDVNLDFLSMEKSIVFHDVYCPEDQPCPFDIHKKESVENAISYFFHQLKQSLGAQAECDYPDAEDKLACVEIMSNQFDEMEAELNEFRKNEAQKNTPEEEAN